MRSANLGFWLEGAPPIVTPASKVGDVKHLSRRTRDSVKGDALNRKKLQRYQELKNGPYLEGIQLNPEELYQICERRIGNSRPKAPQPHGGTSEHKTKKECNCEQKKDVVTR